MKVWRETGTVSTGKKRLGRPRKVSDSYRRHIYMIALRNRRLTVRDIARMPEMDVKNICSHTISTALGVGGLQHWVAPGKPRMISVHKKLRFKVCRAYRHWGVREWRRIAFSDETKIWCSKQGKIYIRHLKRQISFMEGLKWLLEAILPLRDLPISSNCYVPSTRRNVGPLDKFLNYREFADGSLHYFQDSASIHTTPIVSKWAMNTDVLILTLPPKSPDLNIIENIWSYIKQSLAKCLTELRTEMTYG